jgi:3-dehydroquinate dehydratase-2
MPNGSAAGRCLRSLAGVGSGDGGFRARSWRGAAGIAQRRRGNSLTIRLWARRVQAFLSGRALYKVGQIATRQRCDGMAKKIYVLNGPNLNLLGRREPKVYGRATLKDVEALCRKTAAAHKLEVEFRQSNHEGELVDWIQEADSKKAAGIVLNPGAYTHTSVAIHDAIKAVDVPVVEVHVSNIHARESFRRHSYVSPVAKAVICGFGVAGYALAIAGLAGLGAAKSKR